MKWLWRFSLETKRGRRWSMKNMGQKVSGLQTESLVLMKWVSGGQLDIYGQLLLPISALRLVMERKISFQNDDRIGVPSKRSSWHFLSSSATWCNCDWMFEPTWLEPELQKILNEWEVSGVIEFYKTLKTSKELLRKMIDCSAKETIKGFSLILGTGSISGGWIYASK